ncbi:XK-related protein 7-like [Branchiostoma floridae x Branchiostoma belcheri]
MGCLGSAWGSKPVMILRLVLFPLGLYLFDVATDLSLAAQYYSSGDITWFGLTLAFVLVPSLFINFLSTGIALNEEDNALIAGIKLLLGVLQLGVFPAYFKLLYLLVKGEDIDEHVNVDFPLVHLMEAMLESVPQLCLQLYILILTGDQVSVLKVISMLISLLSAVKAVVTSYYYDIKEADRTFNRELAKKLVLLILWKVVELSVRVMVVGMFASAFKAWVILVFVVNVLILTLSVILLEEEARTLTGAMLASVAMAVDTFIMVFNVHRKQTFWLNTVLTLLGNITMVAVWYTLKAGQDWYDIPVLVAVIILSLVSTGLGIKVRILWSPHLQVHPAPDQ